MAFQQVTKGDNMGNYYKNRERANTVTIGGTKTDQSSAATTDINVIVKQAAIHGTAPGSKNPPIYGDFSQLPDNLRDMIELGRSMEGHKNSLPHALQSMTIEELVNSNPQHLAQRMHEEKVYQERHAKLPANLKNLPRQDILNLPEKEFSEMIQPRAQESAQQPKETTT